MQKAEVRPFQEHDRQELRQLFARAGEGSPSASLWHHTPSEAAVYLEPYMNVEPESLFIAIVDGKMVGYLTGSLDSSAFPGESERMSHAIREYRLMFRREPVMFFIRSLRDMAVAAIQREPRSGELDDPRWPAHLHINIAPEARGSGAGGALMTRWLDRLRETDTPGCYLQTLVENTGAVRFFERLGFRKHGPTPLVPGIRYQGERMHQQTMVWNP